MNSTNWSFDEFLAFLLIYASHADIDFSEDERALIKESVTDEEFDVVFHYFNQLTDFQALELILSYKDVYFSTKDEKDHLFEELQKLFNVDGDFSVLEKELLMFLDKLM
jgi:hypothetical protein